MKGDRLVTKEPAGHWQTATLVHAVACDGVRAAMLLDGPMNSLCFSAFCQRWLAPSLQPGDLVMMDNLSAHKSTAALEAIRSAGADVLWLPPYSPDLAPVEKIISKVKEHFRKMAARCWDGLVQAATSALNSITPTDIQNCFKSCGYYL